MPLLKRQHATPALKDAIVLDLGDVSRQAERIRQQAHEQAARIIEEAEARARELTEGAEAAGREQGYAAGYEQGLSEGREQGHGEGFEQHRQQLEQLEANWAQALAQWDQQRRQLEVEARRGVIELALGIAEKLVHRVVEVDETVVLDQLSAALSHVLRPLDVAVRIHPDDRSVVEAALPRLVGEFNHVQHVELVEDAAIGRGGCVLSFGQGQVDASLQTQFERVVRAMVPEDVAPEDSNASAAGAPGSASASASASQSQSPPEAESPGTNGPDAPAPAPAPGPAPE